MGAGCVDWTMGVPAAAAAETNLHHRTLSPSDAKSRPDLQPNPDPNPDPHHSLTTDGQQQFKPLSYETAAIPEPSIHCTPMATETDEIMHPA